MTKRSIMLRYRRISKAVAENWQIILANTIAIILAAGFWNPYDVKYFIKWHDDYFAKGKLLDVYTGPLEDKVAYFPLAVILFVVFHALATKISSDVVVWRLVDKIPLLLSFNAIYYILSKKYGKKAGYIWLLALGTYLTILGYQFDLIIALLVLLAAIYAVQGKRLWYGIYISIATLVKQTLVILHIIPVIELLKKRDFKELAKYISVSALIITIPVLPFFVRDPVAFINKTFLFHARRPPQHSIWAAPYYIANFNSDAMPSWFYELWIVAMAILMTWVILKMWREKEFAPTTYLKYMVIITTGFIATSKVVNPPYVLWPTPPLIMLAVSATKNGRGNKCFAEDLVFIHLLAHLIVAFIGFAIFFPGMVVGYPIFIPEDLNWVPADKFVIDSGVPFNVIYYLALLFRSIMFVRVYFETLLAISNYVAGALCIVLALTLLYTIIKLKDY